MKIPPLEPTNLLRQMMLLVERTRRAESNAKRRRDTAPKAPETTRDVHHPPQIW